MGKTFQCPDCGQNHTLPIKKVTTSENGIASIVSFIQSIPVEGKSLLLICDEHTNEVAGKELETQLKSAYKVEKLILQTHGYSKVYAEEYYFPEIRTKSADKDFIVTVGTGSCTDLGKYVGNETNKPVIAFPTAPSMNAYTSGVAAYLANGIKMTTPVKPCTGVLIDTKINSQAPMILIQSGFADSMAKAYANIDWRINAILTGEHYCTLPLKITTNAEKSYKQYGDKIQARDEATIASLMEGLTMGGFSMVLAGKSAPASGGEHLISHSLDMHAHRNHREVYSYHGLQVGVGVLMSALIFERLQKVEKPVRRSIDYDSTIQGLFKDESTKFQKAFAQKKVDIDKFLNHWEELKPVFAMPPSYQETLGYLKKTGCPTRFSEIDVNEELISFVIRSARYIRNRITLLDIADELGVLEETFQDTKSFMV
jgi:glycerol-1-phosphate dehydrogenase [NAD(P)+]